jgi:hypothetical protein
MSKRAKGLVARLQKGARKTQAIFDSLTDEQWQMTLYEEPLIWTMRDLLAHFLSAEEGLLRMAQNVAAGGEGAPEDFDYDAFNASEQTRLAGTEPEKLLTDLAAARQTTIAWVEALDEDALDRKGHHPALGEITLEDMINAIYGHQLMHVRDLRPLLRTT